MWSLRVFDRLRRGLRLGTAVAQEGSAEEGLSNSIEKLRMAWIEAALFVLNISQKPDVAVLGISSAIEREGKSTACMGLGVALAREIDGRVLIVECEAGNSGISKLFGLDPVPGLVEFIEQPPVEMEQILRRTDTPRLDVVTIGGSRQDGPPSASSNQLMSSRIRRHIPTMIKNFKDQYDYIVLDLPPLTRNAYALDLTREADRIFLSVKTDVTPLGQMSIAMQMVEEDKLTALLLMTGSRRTLPALLTGTTRRDSALKIIEIPELPPARDREALLVSALMGNQYEQSDMLDRTVRV